MPRKRFTEYPKYPEVLYVFLDENDGFVADPDPTELLGPGTDEVRCARYKLDGVVVIKQAAVMVDGGKIIVLDG